jgi:hypothetical protein
MSGAGRGFWQGDRVKPWGWPDVAVMRGTGRALDGCRAAGLIELSRFENEVRSLVM